MKKKTLPECEVAHHLVLYNASGYPLKAKLLLVNAYTNSHRKNGQNEI